MIRLFFIVVLACTFIEARNKPKIQIFEIHDTDNGLKLKKIDKKSPNHDAVKMDLTELLLPRNNRVEELTKRLIDKLKDVRGEDIYMVGENPNLFIMGKDFKPGEDEKYGEASVERAKNRPGTVQHNTDILMKLLAARNNKKQDRASALRSKNDDIYDRTSALHQKRIYDTDDDNTDD